MLTCRGCSTQHGAHIHKYPLHGRYHASTPNTGNTFFFKLVIAIQICWVYDPIQSSTKRCMLNVVKTHSFLFQTKGKISHAKITVSKIHKPMSGYFHSVKMRRKILCGVGHMITSQSFDLLY